MTHTIFNVPHEHTAADPSGGALTADEHLAQSDYAPIATPSTPPANHVALYAKADGMYYLLDDDTEIGPLVDATVGSGAPATVDYLVGTASGGLSNEIVVGTTPGGELGGTWGSPTVDATHSGSSHAATQTAAEATAASALSTHVAASDPHTGYVLESLLDAKGDLIAASADNTPAKVTVGADGTVLSADSAQSAGVKWIGGGLVLLEQYTASASATLDFTSISSAYDEYILELLGLIPATNTQNLLLRVRTGGSYDAGNNYYYGWNYAANAGAAGVVNGGPVGGVVIFTSVDNTLEGVNGQIRLYSPGGLKRKSMTINVAASQASFAYGANGFGLWTNTAAYDAVRLLFASGNISSGIARLYGVVR